MLPHARAYVAAPLGTVGVQGNGVGMAGTTNGRTQHRAASAAPARPCHWAVMVKLKVRLCRCLEV